MVFGCFWWLVLAGSGFVAFVTFSQLWPADEIAAGQLTVADPFGFAGGRGSFAMEIPALNEGLNGKISYKVVFEWENCL